MGRPEGCLTPGAGSLGGCADGMHGNPLGGSLNRGDPDRLPSGQKLCNVHAAVYSSRAYSYSSAMRENRVVDALHARGCVCGLCAWPCNPGIPSSPNRVRHFASHVRLRPTRFTTSPGFFPNLNHRIALRRNRYSVRSSRHPPIWKNAIAFLIHLSAMS